MRPKKDSTKPQGKSSRIPRRTGSSNGAKDEHSEESAEEASEEEEDVAQSTALNKILNRFDELEAKVKSVQSTVDEGNKAQDFNAKQAEDALKSHVADFIETKRSLLALTK